MLKFLKEFFGPKIAVSKERPVYDEKLICRCNSEYSHRTYTDQNGETVVECIQCKHFIKLPAQ